MALANILSRRIVLKGTSASLPMLAVPAPPPPAMVVDVDPHPEWLALWRAARAAVSAHSGDDNTHLAWAQYENLTDRITTTPASTVAGVAAQLALLAEEDAFGLGHQVQAALARAAECLIAAPVAGGNGHA